MSYYRFRKTLSAPGLLREVRASFERIEDTVAGRGLNLTDCLMSGLAIFGLKYASLLQFERDARGKALIRSNLKSLYAVGRAPSDTTLRERLDEVDPHGLRRAFKRVWAALQRGGGLEGFTCLGGHYLLSVDGTGYFSSSKVHCDHCCRKRHRDGRITYYHQLLGAVLVHPEQREVFPLAPEPIVKGDGARKNDCERNAAKRLLKDVRREHPHLKLIAVEDALASNGPHIELLKELDMRFVLGVKPGDHALLFQWVETTPGTRTFETTDADGTVHRFRYLNGAPLNDANFQLEVNFPGVLGVQAQRQGTAFLVGHRPADRRLQPHGLDARRAGPVADRERDVQYPEEPRLSLRAQLRSRREASGDGVRVPDDAGVSHRPNPAALLPADRRQPPAPNRNRECR